MVPWFPSYQLHQVLPNVPQRDFLLRNQSESHSSREESTARQPRTRKGDCDQVCQIKWQSGGRMELLFAQKLGQGQPLRTHGEVFSLPEHRCSSASLSFFFFGTRNRTQALALARQAAETLNQIPGPPASLFSCDPVTSPLQPPFAMVRMGIIPLPSQAG